MPKKEYDKRIFRLLFILNKLDSGGKVSTSELAGEFNVSVRSVQRDIDLLQLTGFLLSSPERGVYTFEEGFSLKKVRLTQEEASLLSLINETVRPLGGPFRNTFSRIFRKVIQQEYTSPYFLKIPRSGSLKNSPFIGPLEKAVELSRKVVISYESGEKIKEHRVRPLKIAFYEGLWYLLARDDTAGKLLKFRFEKIRAVKKLGEYFAEPENLKTILDRSVNAWFSENEGRTIVLSVSKEAAEFFRDHQHLPFQKVVKEGKDGSLLLQAKASHDMEIIPTVLKWIPHIAVIEPADLKDQVRTLVEKYLGK